MYGKVFDTIYNGTLYGQWEALVTMQQLIVLADADGVVDMTPMAISARTSIPREIIDKGLEVLAAPDKYTRTPGSDGRRIELIDDHRPWGWVLVNYEKYCKLQNRNTVRAQTRERVRKHRESKKKVKDVTQCNASNEKKRHVDIDIPIDGDGKEQTIGRKIDRFSDFWSAYPKKVKKKTAKGIWKQKKLDSKADQLVEDIATRIQSDGRWIEGFVPDPTTYLRQERWEDEISETKRKTFVKGNESAVRRFIDG